MHISKKTIAMTAIPIAASAGIAAAFSVVTGTGIGTTTASNNKAQFTTTVTVPASLDIGGSGPIAITVKNTGTAAEKVRSLVIKDPVVVTAAAGQTCPDGSFTATYNKAPLPSRVLGNGDEFAAASGTLTFVNLENADQSGCAGAHVVITVTASSVPPTT